VAVEQKEQFVSAAETTPVPPVALTILAEAGRLDGSNGRYEKFLTDLGGLYRDDAAYQAALAADDGRPVYWVESSQTEDGPGGLITGISVLEPGTVGAEYAMTRGHLHAVADRSELYVGLSGRGVMILESLDGRSEVLDVAPGQAVYVPGHWVHRSVNVGTERFATLFCYAADAGQDYAIIERAGGMRSLVIKDGDGYAVQANPDHRGYVPAGRP
jgi:glucose-6-phosphate isomerase